MFDRPTGWRFPVLLSSVRLCEHRLGEGDRIVAPRRLFLGQELLRSRPNARVVTPLVRIVDLRGRLDVANPLPICTHIYQLPRSMVGYPITRE